MLSKLIHNNISYLHPPQWSIKQIQNQVILFNNFTSDSFSYYQIPMKSSELVAIYKSTTQYTVSNTPKLIMINPQLQTSTIQLFIQQAPYTLNKLLNKTTPKLQIYTYLKTIIQTIQYLVNKYGYFSIHDSMIRVTTNNYIIIWIHQNYYSIYRQYPLDIKNNMAGTLTMIYQVFNILENIGCQKQIEYLKIKISFQKSMSFQKFITIIDTNIKSIKKTKQKQKSTTIPQFLKTKHSNLRNISLKNLSMPSTLKNKSNKPNILSSSIKSLTNNKFINQYRQQHLHISNLSHSNQKYPYHHHNNPQQCITERRSQTTKKPPPNSQHKYPLFRQQSHPKITHSNQASTTLFQSLGFIQSTSSNKGYYHYYDQQDKCLPISNHSSKQFGLADNPKQIDRIKSLKKHLIPKSCKILQQTSQKNPYYLNNIQDHHHNKQQQLQIEKDFNKLLDSKHQIFNKNNNHLLGELQKQIDNILLA